MGGISKEDFFKKARRLHRGQADGNVTIRVPTRLVVRESCGCPPGGAMGWPLGDQPSADCGDADMGALAFVSPQVLRSQLIDALVDVTSHEMYRLNLDSIGSLCGRLVAACEESLARGEAESFQLEMHKILEGQGNPARAEQLIGNQSLGTALNRHDNYRLQYNQPLPLPELLDSMYLELDGQPAANLSN